METTRLPYSSIDVETYSGLDMELPLDLVLVLNLHQITGSVDIQVEFLSHVSIVQTISSPLSYINSQNQDIVTVSLLYWYDYY